MLTRATEILSFFEERGYDAYIVGGYVRDTLLGRNSKDIDIATNAPVSVIQELGGTYISKNNELDVFSIDGIEVARFRTETYNNDSRVPISQYIDDFESDCARRDFTINSMGIDRNGNIIDFFSGKKDIEQKIIKCVGNASDRFEEDPLRIIRALRFSAVLEFELDEDIQNNIIEYVKNN